MPNPRKNPPILNQTDLTVKRLIEHRPATIADIARILSMTAGQVKAVLEKLELRNDVFHIHITTRQDNGAPVRRNLYLPNVSHDSAQLKYLLREVKRALNETLPTLKGDLDDQVRLMQELDIAFNMLYTGLASVANRRKVDDDV